MSCKSNDAPRRKLRWASNNAGDLDSHKLGLSGNQLIDSLENDDSRQQPQSLR